MNPSEGRVLSFMDDIDKKSDLERERDEIRHSLDGKLKFLDKCKQDAKDQCIDKIFAKLYNDATPLNDEYKVAYKDDLDTGFRDFIGSKSDKGMDYYIREAIKRSPFTKRVIEAVDTMIEDEYKDKEINIDNIDPEDLVFKSSDDTTKKLEVISRDLSGDDISEQIRNQVKQTALSEIRRAKEEKEGLKRMEDELAKDPSINSQEAIESALELRGVKDIRFYTPSLFEGVMINKYNHILKDIESGNYVDAPLYGAMESFREEYANLYSESVKEAIMKKVSPVIKKIKEVKAKIINKIKALKNKANKDKKSSANLNESDEGKIDDYELQIIEFEKEFNNKLMDLAAKAVKVCKDAGINPYNDDYLNNPEVKVKVDKLAEEAAKLGEECATEIDKLVNLINKESGFFEDTDNLHGFDNDSLMDHAFIEAVKEYTALSMLKALKLESFKHRDVEELAEAYAHNL